MKIKKILILFLSIFSVAFLVFLFFSIGKAFVDRDKEKVTILRLAEIHADNYPTSLACYEFSRLVNERTKGRIKIEVYTEGRLFTDEGDAIEALQKGNIDFARVSCSPVGYIVPRTNLVQLPFLFRDHEHYLKVITGSIGNFIIDSIELEDVGLVGLCLYDSGARSFYFKNKVESFEEFAGKKIRVQTTPVMTNMCALYGATGIIGIPASEVYNKILNGIVDGAENNIPTYENMGDYLAAPYYVKTAHTRVPDILLASSESLSKLSMSDVKIIKECAKLTQKYQIEKWAEKEKESENIIKNISTIITLPDSEIEKFRDSVKPIYSEYEEDYGKVINLIRETK